MPLYEYACPKCGHIFEELTKSSDQSCKTCPQCAWPKADRVLSATRMAGSGKSGAASSAQSSGGCAPRGGFS